MQALSCYNPESQAIIDPALCALGSDSLGLTARSYLSERGLFAKFVWPDWPEQLKDHVAARVDEFHQEYPKMRRASEGSAEWQAVFRDWRTDSESVRVIVDAFAKSFGDRLMWVESERDARGRITARNRIEGIGNVTLHLFWRDSSVVPEGSVADADRQSFQDSVREVFGWARSRIGHILDAVHDRLSAVYGDRFRGLYVYGSYARPDAGIELPIDSDLDVALILSDFVSVHEERDRFEDIVYDLSLEHGLAISVVPVREAEYRDRTSSFTREISSYAVPAR
jgi:uncharacterized protein